MIRELHDAAAEFAPPSDAVWQRLIPPDGDEQIIHHDLAPWNLIVPDGAEDSGVGWQWIDWDVAGPGSRLWDLAYAAHGFVPLSDDAFRRPDRQTARRLSVFADAYDLSDDQRHALVPLLVHRTRSMYEFLHDQAKKKVQPWTNLWEEGHGDTWQADARYIEERQELWYHALLT